MHFTLYSLGDTAFLAQILNAVALLTGTGDFKQLVSCGMLLGVLAVVLQSLFQGAKSLPFQHVFMGWLVYAGLFGPACQVTLEDAYTVEVRVVDHAPIGVGLAGSVISHLGYTLTRLFETAYAPIAPGLTSHGFIESLHVLNTVRRSLAQDIGLFHAWDQALGGGKEGNGVNTRRSWVNYLQECTLNKVDLPHSADYTSAETLLRQPIDAALHFPSRVHGTHLYLSAGHPQGEDQDCTQAWAALQAATQHLNSPSVQAYLQQKIGAHPLSTLRHALEAVSQSSTASLKYVQTALLEPLYYEAAAGRYRDFQDLSSALMVEQAIQQRNTQWAAEQSTFLTIIRPMMTFFEGLVYAVTPLLAFMIVMGLFGVQLAGRYAQTLLWMQLWMPVLSIINLFIHMAATRAMASYRASGLDSMYSLNHASQVLQHWIATGGMLAAATPVISLFVVTGSSYAMTSLEGKVVGAEHIDEKIQTPDIVKPAPFLGLPAMYQQDHFSRTHRTGAETTFGSVNLGAVVESGLQSAQQRDRQASENFGQVLNRAFSDQASLAQRYARYEALDHVFASQQGEDWHIANQATKQFMDKAQIDATHASKIRGAFLAQLTGQADASVTAQAMIPLEGTKVGGGVKAGIGGALRGSTESSSEHQQQMSAAEITDFVRNVQSRHGIAQRLQDQLAHGYKTQQGKQFEQTLQEDLRQEYRHAAEQKVSTREQVLQWTKQKSQWGMSQNVDLKTLSAAIAQDQQARTQSWQAFHRLSPQDQQDVVQQDSWYQTYAGGSVSPAVARHMALLKKMSALGQYPAIAQLAGQALHQDITAPDPQRFKPLPTSPGPTHITHATAEAATLSQRLSRDAMAKQAHTKPSPEAPGEALQAHAQRAHQALRQRGQRMETQLSEPEENKAWSRLMAAPSSPSLKVRFWGAQDHVTTQAQQQYHRLVGTVEAGLGASFERFDQSMTQLAAMPDKSLTTAATPTNEQGVMAQGASQAHAWMKQGRDLSQGAQSLTPRQQGQYYAAALWTALKAGPEQAAKFWQQYGQQFKSTQQALARSQFQLSTPQAAVYTEALYARLFETDATSVNTAAQTLRGEYADRQPAEVNKMIEILKNAPRAGDQAGSFLAQANLAGINQARRSVIEPLP
jgi:conjugal transfer mating pair stabilization protein TraG